MRLSLSHITPRQQNPDSDPVTIEVEGDDYKTQKNPLPPREQ